MSNLGSLVVKISAEMKGFTQGMDQVAKATGDLGKFAKTSFDVAVKAATAGGIALTAVGANATRMAIDFESSFAGVKKTVDATESEFADLAKGFRQLAQEVPVNVNQLNAIGESAGALGIAKENILEFTKTISMMSTTTNLSAENAANAFARIATLTGLPASEFQKLGSAIVDLGNKGSTTESEITEMALRIAGAGKTVGMSVPDIAALAASLSNVGIEAEMGGSAISKIIISIASDISKGGDDLKRWADVAGMSSAQFAAAFKDNAANALDAFVQGLGKIQTSGGDLFATLDTLDIKETRMRDTTLRLASAGDRLAKDLDISREAFAKNTALTDEAGKRYETAASKMQVFQNKLADTQITLGSAFIPMLTKALEMAEPFVKMLADWANQFAALDPVTQQIIAGVVGFSAVLGPSVMALSGLIRAFQTVIPLVQSLWALLAAHPFVLIGTAVAALAILIYKHWDEIHAATQKLAKGFNEIMAKGLDPVVKGITAARDYIISIIQALVNGVKSQLDKLTAVFTSVKSGVEGVEASFKWLYDKVVGHSYVPDMVEEIGDHMRNLDVQMTAPARTAVVNTGRVFEGATLTWGSTISQFVSTANQSWGSLSQTVAGNLARMTDETVKWGDVVKQMGIQLMTNMITLVIGLATQWAVGEAMRTAATGAGESARVGMTMAGNATIVASNGAAATASVSIWGAATAAIGGFFATIGAGFAAVTGALVAAVVAVGTFIMGVLSAIAEALSATVFGIPFAGAILVGIGLIAAALAATDNLPEFAMGGIVTGPTVGLMGEAGSAEAAIPLNDRGAKFMQSAMGFGGGGEQTIILQIDSRTMARALVPKMHDVVQLKLGYTGL